MSTAALRPIPGPDQIFDKLVVVTHQRAELQESTIQVLQSLVYAQTPNVIIASPQFSFQFPFGNWRPTYIQNGDDEMLGYPFVAKEVVFMGGYSALCLAITIHNIVMEAERLAMPEITLRFLSKYIYEIENYAPTIQQLFSKKKILEKDFFENIEQNIMSFESPAKSQVQGSFRASPYDLQGRYIVGDSSMRVHVIIEK